MNTYYFPACGFGFWYLLGKYQQIDRTKNDIYIGSSAGSLVFVCSLIDRKHNLFETLVDCAHSALRQTTNVFNLHTLVSHFLDNIELLIDRDNLESKLSRIRIQVTEISGFAVRKHQIQPTSLNHLKQLCLASCYIPIVSNYNYRLRYAIDGMNCVDGFIADLYSPNVFQTFNVYPYRGLIIPSKERVAEMYLTGLNESTTEKVFWIIHPYNAIAFCVLICFIYGGAYYGASY